MFETAQKMLQLLGSGVPRTPVSRPPISKLSKIVRPAGYGHACDSFCCVWAHRTLLRVSFPHVLPMAMPNARNKNRARLQSFCAASDSKRTGRHSAFVSRNQTYALAFLALIGLHRRFPPMRYHSRDINRRRTIISPLTPFLVPDQ